MKCWLQLVCTPLRHKEPSREILLPLEIVMRRYFLCKITHVRNHLKILTKRSNTGLSAWFYYTNVNTFEVLKYLYNLVHYISLNPE